ncbi:hypothetical protein LCGC14_2275400 [marine sediment metagenome]|uniref:Uncharacterized protein n=1 Tax=marine sediment metagenome TaxID=412755 RepID=A0A0F9DHX8_9ZZZZ
MLTLAKLAVGIALGAMLVKENKHVDAAYKVLRKKVVTAWETFRPSHADVHEQNGPS